MNENEERRRRQGRRGLATPVSILLILFSLTMVSTVAYHYSLAQIESRKEDLKLIAAEEKMLDMEAAISSSAWAPGSIRALAFSDYGGELRVDPEANPLLINVTLGDETSTVFDSNTGRFLYELPSTVVGHLGRWLRGDSRPIVNQSTAYQAQMSVETGDERQELRARYRPLMSSSVGGLVADRYVNSIRIYVINLNGSQAIQSGGEFHVKATCTGVATSVYTFNTSEEVAEVTAVLDGSTRTLQVPLTSSPSGATVRVEVVVSHVKVEGVGV
jgi:hypothetical protein